MTDPVAPSWCNHFRNIPYLDKGRSRAGLDCYGLVLLVNREQFGRELPDYLYTSSVDHDSVAATIDANLPLDFVKVDQPEPGDLVMLKVKGRPWHCGVYVAPGLMLQVIDGMVSNISRLDSVHWHCRLLGYHRPVSA